MISHRLLYWRRINLAWIIEYGPNTSPNSKCLSSYGVRPGTSEPRTNSAGYQGLDHLASGEIRHLQQRDSSKHSKS